MNFSSTHSETLSFESNVSEFWNISDFLELIPVTLHKASIVPRYALVRQFINQGGSYSRNTIRYFETQRLYGYIWEFD